MREEPTAYEISDRVDPVERGPHVRVHDDSAVGNFDAAVGDARLVDVRSPAHGQQHARRGHGLAVGQDRSSLVAHDLDVLGRLRRAQ